MSNLLYNRKILVEVVDKKGNGIAFNSRDNKTKGFDISFNVQKNQEKEPNQSTVTIYGISEENRRKIDKELYYVVLTAGYEGNMRVLSVGEISEIEHEYERPGVKTTLTFQDGLKSYAESTISRTFLSGTKVKDIVKELSSSMGLSEPRTFDLSDSITIGSSQTLAGSSSKYLTQICDKYNLKWSIQNNKLIVKKTNTGINNTAFDINEDTGLVGSITKKVIRIPKKDKAKSKKNKDKEDLISIKTLLLPEVIPGSYVKISSKFFKESYGVVDSVNHSGSSFENEFYSTMEAQVLE